MLCVLVRTSARFFAGAAESSGFEYEYVFRADPVGVWSSRPSSNDLCSSWESSLVFDRNPIVVRWISPLVETLAVVANCLVVLLRHRLTGDPISHSLAIPPDVNRCQRRNPINHRAHDDDV